ncbi:hypothetical protein ACGFX4_10680 [Kitasatospora sp. NPDC048365]|uniref:hypothetical protein n=1 Tax=Kitasatospora sp. NPDC048365 TaxID=3364050 RepID=UPI00371597E4
MSGDNIKITLSYLNGRVADLQALEGEVQGEKTNWTKAPEALKAGQDLFTAAKSLKVNYSTYAGSVKDGIGAVFTTVQTIADDLLSAGRTLHESNDDALSETQVLDVFHDVLTGVTPTSTPPS